MKMDEDEKQYINDVFGGDENARNEFSREYTKEMFHWKDIILAAKVFPELEKEAKDLIAKRLGYLPHPTVTIGFEPMLRSLYHQLQIGQINETEFNLQTDEIITLIRN